MGGGKPPGPGSVSAPQGSVQDGTLVLQPAPVPAPTGVGAPAPVSPAPAAAKQETDAAIEALDLATTAKRAAYSLKKKHPSVTFTSGRRGKADQARAMASNVALNRKWIEQTYAKTTARTKLQEWVDKNPDKKTKDEIAAGLETVLDTLSGAQLDSLSRHLTGRAFDVKPVETDAAAIKKTIRALKGLHRFLEKEGGLVRWHAQF